MPIVYEIVTSIAIILIATYDFLSYTLRCTRFLLFYSHFKIKK